MSKEERIQEQVAEKLGFRWTNGLMAPHTIDLPNGEPIQEADDYHRLLWVALIAAETKLEPQTVAETIDALARQIIAQVAEDAVLLAFARHDLQFDPDVDEPSQLEVAADVVRCLTGDEQGCDAEDPDNPERYSYGFVMDKLRRIHSSAPDTKGLEMALEQSLALLKECDAALVSHHEMGFVSRFVDTKIDDAHGKRNQTNLKRNGNLWFLPDGSMYVYYTPTHWRKAGTQ